MSTYTKPLPGVLDYTINYASWLGTDTIATSVWEADDGITIDSNTNDTTSTTVVVSGGTLYQQYKLINTVTTVGPPSLTDRRCIYVKIVECRE